MYGLEEIVLNELEPYEGKNVSFCGSTKKVTGSVDVIMK